MCRKCEVKGLSIMLLQGHADKRLTGNYIVLLEEIYAHS
jgi:hypothetical protein